MTVPGEIHRAERLRLPPARPRPHRDDTVDSYIQRLARANHLKPGYLRTYLCEPPAHRGRPRLGRLAAVSGRTASALWRALTDLRCAHCEKPLPEPADSGRPARWCSPNCRQAAHRERHQDHRRPRGRPVTESECQRCGTLIIKSRPARWCSGTCRNADYRRRRSETSRNSAKRVCERCGMLITKGRSARWCSRTCRNADYDERRRASRTRPKPRQPIQIRPPDGVTCGLCGAPLNLAGKGRPPLWCSPNCRQGAHRERRRAGQQGRHAGWEHKPVISTTAANSRPRRRNERRAAVTGAKTRCANLACARAFEPSAAGRPARYCSPACRQAAHRARVRIAEAERHLAAAG